MRELRALGLTDDGKSLVLVDLSRGAEGERFRVAADERLRAALRSGTPRAAAAPQAETRVESALSPREIQARLRAGATAEEVAKAAGIPVGRVQRYEAPILAERARVVSEARRASAPGPHRNTPGRPLGALVDDRLTEEGLDPEGVAWDAKRRPDGTWLVTLAVDEGAPVRATWSWDPQARRVRSVDAGANAVLAPMPIPPAGPDPLTAVAEAAGVAASALETPEGRNEARQREALAVGDDVRRRTPAPSRTARSNGLVVLAGRSDDSPAPTDAHDSESVPAASAEPDDAIPGGDQLPTPARGARERMRAEAADLLMPGAEPSARPSRQERFPYEAAVPVPPVVDAVRPTQPGGLERSPETDLPGPAAPEVAMPEVATAEVATAEVATAEIAMADVAVPEVSAPEVGAADEMVPPLTGGPAAAKAAARVGSGRRRSAVPAWDDIMFGARRS